jgi:two-component system NtrC family response regulator
MARTVLVIDDEDNMRWVLDRALKKAGYDVLTASRGDKGLELFALNPVDLVLLDLKMPGMDGLAVLRELRQRSKSVPILLLTAYATVPTAVEAMQVGATDYLRKPFDLESVLAKVHQFISESVSGTPTVETSLPVLGFQQFIGAAPALTHPLSQAATAAQTTYTVLVRGEPGTGRRHLARLIHMNSQGESPGRLVTVDCAGLPLPLLREELMGKPTEDSPGGCWQQAFGGSLLLANVGTLPDTFVDELVAHLLQCLRDTRRPHGLRLLMTSDQYLTPAWQPLLDRAISIELPPLRERLADIPLLLAGFVPDATWSREACGLLSEYDWPGNVAEFKRVVEQASYLAGEETVLPAHLPAHLQSDVAVVPGRLVLPPEGIELEEVEQDLIRQALAMTRGNKARAARLLGLSRPTLLYRLEKYGITDE